LQEHPIEVVLVGGRARSRQERRRVRREQIDCVEAARHEVRREPSGDARKGGGEPGYRVPAGGAEDDGPDGHHEHEAGVGRAMAHDRDEDERRREEAAWGPLHQPADEGPHEPRVLGDTDTEQRHQHGAQRMKSRERLDHAGQRLDKLRRRQEALDDHRLAGEAC